MRLEIDNRRRKISIKFYTLGFGILYASFWKIVTFRFTDYSASKNTSPVREGLVAMLGPAIDSGLVCTLTAIPILLAGDYLKAQGVAGLQVALHSFDTLIPLYGSYLLMGVVFFFAFSTMFSYSYYGTACASYLFGTKRGARGYTYFYLLMIVVSCIITLDTVVTIMDLSFALMSIPTMLSLIRLRGKVKAQIPRIKEELSKA